MYENGTNIGNTPDCPDCEQYERENEQLREEVLRLRLENQRIMELAKSADPKVACMDFSGLRWTINQMLHPETTND